MLTSSPAEPFHSSLDGLYDYHLRLRARLQPLGFLVGFGEAERAAFDRPLRPVPVWGVKYTLL